MLKHEQQRLAELGERSAKEEEVRGQEKGEKEDREGRGEAREEGKGRGGEKVEDCSAEQCEDHREKLPQEAMRQAWKAG